jgi:hypothetical protein
VKLPILILVAKKPHVDAIVVDPHMVVIHMQIGRNMVDDVLLDIWKN